MFFLHSIFPDLLVARSVSWQETLSMYKYISTYAASLDKRRFFLLRYLYVCLVHTEPPDKTHVSSHCCCLCVISSFHLSRSTRCTKCLFARDILHVQVHVNIYSLHEVYLGKRHFLCKGLPFYMYLLDSVSLDKKHLFISSVFIYLLILCMCIRCINVS